MSNYLHHRESAMHTPETSRVLSRIQAEMAQGYLEVSAEGISFREVAAVYTTILLEARDRMRESLRSLFRLHPAH